MIFKRYELGNTKLMTQTEAPIADRHHPHRRRAAQPDCRRYRRQSRQGTRGPGRRARHGADLVLFTELFIAGYPPEDLVLKPAF
jgi:hypothetical protein